MAGAKRKRVLSDGEEEVLPTQHRKRAIAIMEGKVASLTNEISALQAAIEDMRKLHGELAQVNAQLEQRSKSTWSNGAVADLVGAASSRAGAPPGCGPLIAADAVGSPAEYASCACVEQPTSPPNFGESNSTATVLDTAPSDPLALANAVPLSESPSHASNDGRTADNRLPTGSAAATAATAATGSDLWETLMMSNLAHDVLDNGDIFAPDCVLRLTANSVTGHPADVALVAPGANPSVAYHDAAPSPLGSASAMPMSGVAADLTEVHLPPAPGSCSNGPTGRMYGSLPDCSSCVVAAASLVTAQSSPSAPAAASPLLQQPLPQPQQPQHIGEACRQAANIAGDGSPRTMPRPTPLEPTACPHSLLQPGPAPAPAWVVAPSPSPVPPPAALLTSASGLYLSALPGALPLPLLCEDRAGGEPGGGGAAAAAHGADTSGSDGAGSAGPGTAPLSALERAPLPLPPLAAAAGACGEAQAQSSPRAAPPQSVAQLQPSGGVGGGVAACAGPSPTLAEAAAAAAASGGGGGWSTGAAGGDGLIHVSTPVKTSSVSRALRHTPATTISGGDAVALDPNQVPGCSAAGSESPSSVVAAVAAVAAAPAAAPAEPAASQPAGTLAYGRQWPPPPYTSAAPPYGAPYAPYPVGAYGASPVRTVRWRAVPRIAAPPPLAPMMGWPFPPAAATAPPPPPPATVDYAVEPMLVQYLPAQPPLSLPYMPPSGPVGSAAGGDGGWQSLPPVWGTSIGPVPPAPNAAVAVPCAAGAPPLV